MSLFLHVKTKNAKGALAKIAAFLHRIGRDPYLDWQLILLLAFVVAIALVSVGFLAFGNASHTGRAATVATPKTLFDVNTLNKVLSDFSNKAKETADLQKGYNGQNDPSM